MSLPRVRSPRRELLPQLLVGVLLLAYVALGAYEVWFIVSASANIPISDTWNFVPALASFARNGHIAWGGVFDFYGEGRPVLERIGLLLSARYFSLNVQTVKLLAVPVGFIELACAVCAFRWALPKLRFAWVLLVVLPVAVMIFCLNNWQNLLDEWNLMNLAAVALTFLALLLTARLGSSRRRELLVALLLACAIASFTGESGTLSWIVCGLVLWLLPADSRLFDRIAFSVVAVAFLVVYFVGGPSPSGGGALHHLGKVFDFAFICLGNGVVGGAVKGLGAPRAIGILEAVVALALAVVTLLVPALRRDGAARVGFGLMAFGVMGAVATGLSRVQIGLGSAISSRYVVLTATVAIGIYLLLVRIAALRLAQSSAARPPARRLLPALLPSVLVVCLLVASFSADATEAKAASYKKKYYVSLLEMTCDPGAYSNKSLSRFDHSGGLDEHDKVQLLDEIGDLRRAHISVFQDDRCQDYDALARRRDKRNGL